MEGGEAGYGDELGSPEADVEELHAEVENKVVDKDIVESVTI